MWSVNKTGEGWFYFTEKGEIKRAYITKENMEECNNFIKGLGRLPKKGEIDKFRNERKHSPKIEKVDFKI